MRRGLGGLRLPRGPEAIEILHAAFDAGIRHFDTARAYDDNERVVGEALRGRDPRALSFF